MKKLLLLFFVLLLNGCVEKVEGVIQVPQENAPVTESYPLEVVEKRLDFSYFDVLDKTVVSPNGTTIERYKFDRDKDYYDGEYPILFKVIEPGTPVIKLDTKRYVYTIHAENVVNSFDCYAYTINGGEKKSPMDTLLYLYENESYWFIMLDSLGIRYKREDYVYTVS